MTKRLKSRSQDKGDGGDPTTIRRLGRWQQGGWYKDHMTKMMMGTL
jgi:hypothetical protein